jgi:uncharacterized membrane protein YbhN (UPF0104 family)
VSREADPDADSSDADADGPDADAPLGLPARRRGLGTWLKLAFLVAVGVLGGLFVARRWDELTGVFGRLSWLAVAAAVLLAVLAQIAAMRAYRTILGDLGAPLPVAAAGRAYFVSQLGKYLPGTVWAVVALVAMSREYRIMRKTSLAAVLLSTAFSLATAFCLAALLLPLGAAQTVRHFWYVGLLIPALLVGLHPRVVSAVLDSALRLARKQPIPDRISYSGTLRAAGWQTLCWLLFGLHAWVLMIGIGAPAARSLPVSIGGFALAYGLGPVFVVAPAGAGVRETGIVLTLGTIVGSAPALAVALVSRIVIVFVDFAQAGVWSLVARRIAPVPPPEPVAGRTDTAR